mmetsp:Transcript_24930/g.71937  ORF Transcript_24930/g.71937 Transcript_24930/m.71937 type:complete len:93 (+) Transcript_24930:246-524(+)
MARQPCALSRRSVAESAWRETSVGEKWVEQTDRQTGSQPSVHPSIVCIVTSHHTRTTCFSLCSVQPVGRPAAVPLPPRRESAGDPLTEIGVV